MALPPIVAQVGANIDGFERAMGDVSKRLNAIDREATRAFSGFEKVGDRLSTIGAGMSAAITLPLLGIGTAAVKVAGDFEGSFNKVSALGEITGKSLDMLKAQAIDLGAKTAFSAQQAADGMAVFASAGFDAEKIYAAMPGTLSLAAAGQISIAESATIVKDTLGQFGLAANETGRIANVLAQASLDTSAKMGELGQTLTYVGPIANAAGQSLEETVAAIIALDAAGIRGEKAGTGLRGVLGSLLSPSKEAAGYLADLGVNVSDASGKILPLSAIMEDFKQKLATVGSAAERSNIVFQVFGREAGNAAQILINTGGPALDGFEQKLLKNGDAADRVAKQLNVGFNYQMDQFRGSVETAGIVLGNVLLPAVNRALSAFTSFVNDAILPAVTWFGKLPQPVQDIGIGFGLLAAAAGPAIYVFGTFISTTASALSALTSLGGTLTTFVVEKIPGMVTGTGTIATALTALQSAAVLTAGVFVGWQLGSWAYAQIPGFKALGDALAESLLAIPGVEAAWLRLVGATGANEAAFDSSEFAIKKQEESLKRLGIVLNKEGISTEEYAKRLHETVQQQIAMANQTGKTDGEVKKSAKTSQDAAGGARIHGDALKETEMKARAFADAQPVLAAKMRIVEGEYKRNIEELAKLQLAMERGELGLGDFAGATERLAVELGSLGTAVQNLPQMPGFTGRIAELDAVGEAYKRLGVTTSGELQRIADQHLADFNTIKGSGIATARELEAAWLTWLESAANAAHQAGEEIPIEVEGILNASTSKTKDGLKEQETAWGNFTKQVSTIVSDLGKDLAAGTINLFKGLFGFDDHNQKLKEESEQLQAELDVRTQAIERFQQDTAAAIAGVESKYAEQLARETGEVRDQLRERQQEYEIYVTDTAAKLETLRGKEATRLAEEQGELAEKLRDKEAEYERYVGTVADKEQDIRKRHADQLAEQLRNLQDNLADRTQAYEDFVADAATKLSRIGGDLNESIRDATRSTGRRIEDEDTDFARDTAKLNEDLRKAEAKGDKEQVATIRRNLAQRQEDHERTITRLREDLAEHTRDAKIRAEEQTNDLKTQLERRARDHAEFVAENALKQQEATEKHREDQAEQLADLHASLAERTAALVAFRATTAAEIEAAAARSAERFAEEEAKLQASLDAKAAQLATYETGAAQKIDDLTAKYLAKQAEEVAALQLGLTNKLTEYDAYRAGVEQKLAELEAAHKGPLDRIREMFAGVFESAANAILRLVSEEVLGKLIGKLAGLATDILPGLGKAAIDNFGGIASAADDAGKAVAKVFGSGTEIVGAGGSAAGSAGGLGGAGGATGAAASGGLAATVSAIASVATAITGVIGLFQNAKQETTLNAIEASTRFSEIHLKALVETGQNLYMAELPVVSGLMKQFIDQHAWRIHDVWTVLGQIRDGFGFGAEDGMALATAGGATINVRVFLNGKELSDAIAEADDFAGGGI